MLAQCGLAVRVVGQETQTYLAPGPEGPVFGRDFDLAQYAWVTAQEPPCSLYLTNEIPGAYPQASKGWGGVNAAGYSNPAYDAACQNALYALPDWPQHREAHQQAQAIFAEDLPSLPLYWRFKVVATRPDLCGVSFEPSSSSALTYLEDFDDAEGCLE